MPKRGDLIAFSRVGYQHWAVYVGHGDVVHLVKDDNSSLPIYDIDRWIRNCKVKKEKLKDVAGGDKWAVNNTHDKKKKPLPTEKILKKALSLVGSNVYYSILRYNCEHFAKELRYGEPKSHQVIKAVVTVGVVVGAVVLVAYIGPGVIVKAAITAADMIFTTLMAALRAVIAPTLWAVQEALTALSPALSLALSPAVSLALPPAVSLALPPALLFLIN